MQPLKPEPRLYAVPGGALSLSGPTLQEFLRAVIAKNARFRFRARGFSMAPFIRDGDVLTVAPLAGPAPRLGDVVAFCHPATQRLLVHRVVAKKSGAFLLRGDNTARCDGFVSAAKILGIVSRVERNGRSARIGRRPERVLLAFLARSGLLFRLRRWRDLLLGRNYLPRITWRGIAAIKTRRTEEKI